MTRSRWIWAPFAVVSAATGTAVPVAVVQAQEFEGQAQQLIFPGKKLTPAFVTLSDAQADAIEHASDARVRNRDVKAWKVEGGGWLVIDQVIGKHEFITYAVGIDAAGGVKDIEILDYRETYGYQVRNADWRAQFVGKTAADPLKLNHDIHLISGATLSCKHVTEGVRRVLATYALVLK
ncbi:MAG TPA: FMN-binding protein [Gemmatimonadales bacterium]|nr:FMN-binding protein [Gemmatimonadales bacterium]